MVDAESCSLGWSRQRHHQAQARKGVGPADFFEDSSNNWLTRYSTESQTLTLPFPLGFLNSGENDYQGSELQQSPQKKSIWQVWVNSCLPAFGSDAGGDSWHGLLHPFGWKLIPTLWWRNILLAKLNWESEQNSILLLKRRNNAPESLALHECPMENLDKWVLQVLSQVCFTPTQSPRQLNSTKRSLEQLLLVWCNVSSLQSATCGKRLSPNKDMRDGDNINAFCVKSRRRELRNRHKYVIQNISQNNEVFELNSELSNCFRLNFYVDIIAISFQLLRWSIECLLKVFLP